MRPIAILVLALVTNPAVTRGVGAQAVERTDTPKRGTVRFTFDPQTMVWNDAFTPHGRRPLGWALTGDSVGAAAGPTLARIEQDVRTAGGLSGFVASLGKGLLAVHEERRVTPIGAEVGITDRLSLGVMVPLVRVQTRARLNLTPAGANLGGFAAEVPLVHKHFATERFPRLFRLIGELGKPSICAANGHVLAGALGLALACDLIVAKEGARFGTPEINVGLFPFMIMALIYRNVGRKKTAEMMLLGEQMSAHEAERIGIVNRVVAGEEFDGVVEEWSRKLASKSPVLMKLGKDAMFRQQDMAFAAVVGPPAHERIVAASCGARTDSAAHSRCDTGVAVHPSTAASTALIGRPPGWQ